ncbi:MAG: hypothetical protein M1835_005795 [Candelina submexicana]|nr:MAG: hypothetical protein M1835_005795 [Candelina submexicana]
MHLLTLYFLTLILLLLPITSATPPPAPSSIPSYLPSPTSSSFPPPTLLSPPPSPPPSPHCIHTGLSLTTPRAAKAIIALLRSTPPHGGCMLSHGEVEKELKTVRTTEKGQMMRQSAKGILGLVASMGFEGGKVGVKW